MSPLTCTLLTIAFVLIAAALTTRWTIKKEAVDADMRFLTYIISASFYVGVAAFGWVLFGILYWVRAAHA